MRIRPIRVLVAVLAAIVIAKGGHATEPATSNGLNIEALQHRLAQAGCYRQGVAGRSDTTLAEATAACPDQHPVLRIEAGVHTAAIKRIAVDRSCSLAATASGDKTVRLWTLPEGRLLRTIRLPIGAGNGGKAYAVALSPDGRTLVAGGWDAAFDRLGDMGVYRIDVTTGATQRFGGFDEVVNQIAFSPDGQRIGIGLAGGSGIRVLDSATGRVLMTDHDVGDAVYGLAFGPDGALLATSYDGFLRRYGPGLDRVAKTQLQGGRHPYGLAVDPTGRLAAVGYEDSAAVSILDAGTLQGVAETGPQGRIDEALSSVAWMPNGQTVVAGGEASETFEGDRRFVLERFDVQARRIGGDIAAADDTITDVQPCPAGLVFAAADPRWGLMTADGVAWSLQGPVAADMRLKRDAGLAISEDAQRLRFGLGSGDKRAVLFDLMVGTLDEAHDPVAGLTGAAVDGLAITDWRDGTAPHIGGSPLPMEAQELARALAIRSDRTGFVLGSSYRLRAFDAAGQERWSVPSPGEIGGVALSADGRIVVAASGDGTLRWHRWSDGQEVLALFVDARDRRWVAWTPTGYYMASPGAEDLIGWHVNRGWDQQADFFPASRFRDRFNRPDVVRLALTTLDEAEALRQADAAAHKSHDLRPLVEHLPPVLDLLSPADGAAVAPGPVTLRYAVRLPSGGTVERVEAFVDGARVEARGLARLEGADTAAGATGSVSVPMPAHDAIVSLVAYAGGKASDAARVTLKAAVPVPGADVLKPSLYALLVGVSHYDNHAFDLGYAAADALSLAEALKSQEGRLYRHVVVKVLTDGQANSAGVKRGLSWLKRQTTAQDLAIVFVAGHGMTDAKGKFWFLTSDADPDELAATAVSQSDFDDVLFDLPGKKLLLLDACHAGAALNAGTRARGSDGTDLSIALNDFAQAEGGVVAYAASTGREFSLERDEWGHGAFTKALIEAVGEGKADLLHQGIVTTATLDLFLERRVKELTDGAQHPVMTRPQTVPDFPIALVR